MSSKQVEKIAESALQLRSDDPHTNQVLEVVDQKVQVVKGFLDKERARLKSVLQTMMVQQTDDSKQGAASVSEDKIKKLRMKAKRAKASVIHFHSIWKISRLNFFKSFSGKSE